MVNSSAMRRGILGWAGDHDSDIAMAWRLLAFTGMRRGEALALRWRDVDLDAGRVAVRRSVGVVKDKGQGEKLVEGATKTGQSPRRRSGRRHRRGPARLPRRARLRR